MVAIPTTLDAEAVCLTRGVGLMYRMLAQGRLFPPWLALLSLPLLSLIPGALTWNSRFLFACGQRETVAPVGIASLPAFPGRESRRFR
jgi:hypothetical protein